MLTVIIFAIVLVVIILLFIAFDIPSKLKKYIKIKPMPKDKKANSNEQLPQMPQEDSDTKINTQNLELGGYEEDFISSQDLINKTSGNIDEEEQDSEWDFNFENEADFNKFLTNASEEDLDKQLQKFNEMFGAGGEYEMLGEDDDDTTDDVAIDDDDVILGKYSGYHVDEDENGVLSEEDAQRYALSRDEDKPSLYDMYCDLPKEMKILFLTDVLKDTNENNDL